MPTEKNNIYTSLEDNSEWIKRELLDLGWGNEIGYCRLPLLSFDKLFELSIKSNKKGRKTLTEDDYNLYGSLALLLFDYHDLFLDKIEEISDDNKIISKLHDDYFKLLKNQIFSWKQYKLNKTELDRWKKIFDKLKVNLSNNL
jgi:hypothetical protein